MILPSGLILIWSGAIVDIPSGFVICDGNNGTPDLRNRFVAGAGGLYAVNATGGGLTHTHTGTTDGHMHVIPAGLDIASGGNQKSSTTINTDSFTTNPGGNLPPYFALAFIMKT